MKEPITKQKLLKYISLRMEIDNQLERLERMKNDERIPAMQMNSGSQHTGVVSDRMANAIIRRIDYEEKILPLIEENQREMDAIEEAVNTLSNPLEREVLRLRYIDGVYRHTPWGDVAKHIYGSDDEKHLQAIYRLHGHALKNIQKLWKDKKS